MKHYYDARAHEYDEWYLGTGVFAGRDRPGWDVAVRRLECDLAALPPRRTLDVACGTGYLTRHLRGDVTGLDQSARMLAIAAQRMPHATFVEGDALSLPFADAAFERLLTAHFYGHLEPSDVERFRDEAFRVASELIVVDSVVRPDHAAVEWQTRTLNDGSSFQVYKRYFTPAMLADELGGEVAVLHVSDWFVAVSSRRPA